ncbi:DUF2567 domain-containing protein [Mycobacterium sp. C31M]
MTSIDLAPPRISRVAAALRVFVAMSAGGAVAGALWAWLAPPAQGIVALTRAGDRVRAYLGNDSDQLFLGAFLLVGFVGVLAVVGAVAVWQWRAHRGPALLAALSAGAATATTVAAGVGAVLVRWRYGVIDVDTAPVSEGNRVHYVFEAPAVFFGHNPFVIGATILLPAAVAAITYALLVASASRDDLGAWPPVQYAGVYPPVPMPVATGTYPTDQGRSGD